MLLLADPIILLAPASGSDASSWTNYYDYLVGCNDLIDSGVYDISLSELCRDALYTSDRYPEHLHQLQGWLSWAGIVEFDAKTLITLIHAIANRVPGLCDKLGIDFSYDSDSPTSIWITTKSDSLILIEQAGITVHPPIVLSRLETDSDLSLAFHLTGGLLVYATCYSESPLLNARDVAILTVIEPSVDEKLAQIEISAVLYEDGNETKQVRLEAVLSPKSLRSAEIETISILNYWPDVNRMFVYVCSLNTLVQFSPYRFASTFVSSLEEMHLSGKADELVSILSRIRTLLTVRTAFDDPGVVFSPPVPNLANHHIKRRKDQIRDGDWGAWRYRISGKEFKLHYWWRDSDKYFILSKIIGHHTNMSIASNTVEKAQVRS